MTISTATTNDIENELIIGLVGSLGVSFDEIYKPLEKGLAAAGYDVQNIRIADNFPPNNNADTPFAKCYWKMQYGTKQRKIHGKDYWARKAIEKIFYLRPELSYKSKKIAYVIRSLKTKDELELLASVYGSNFIAIAIFSEPDASLRHIDKKLHLSGLNIQQAQDIIQDINAQLQLGTEMEISQAEVLHLEDINPDLRMKNNELIARFLLHKDQEETHPDLKRYGQNLLKCYAYANYFIYQNANLAQQIQRFINIIFNDPFAEPTNEEYFMFCAQASAYRSLDLDRQVGAVIVNSEDELVAAGFNDVNKVGGGHFFHHDHPLKTSKDKSDERDFRKEYDFNHLQLDKIVENIKEQLQLANNTTDILRNEISAITEYKRSTHAEMAALLDAARRGIAVRDCTMYVNTYPCHNCTKHIIAAGIRKVVFLHPYTKSKARLMYKNMVRHGLLLDDKTVKDTIIFEPFLGISPNRYMSTFANDKETRLERDAEGRETGRPVRWHLKSDLVAKFVVARPPYVYIAREWVVVFNKVPDISVFYKPGFFG